MGNLKLELGSSPLPYACVRDDLRFLIQILILSLAAALALSLAGVHLWAWA
jgi:hypothetical protein